ncbi:ANTAR domain-containing protein [Bosea sp. 117]|uniref:ANTAR domain-containing response regulator n=1 Tax=Bosea sp. 117 TaxID=1125973 RepID=UPI0004949630|nr:ANTAR domain-containing protein [Bosea sp. 117]
MKDADMPSSPEKVENSGFGTLRTLQGLRVVVETDVEDQLDLLLRELKKLRVLPRLVNRRADILPADGEVIFCDYSPGLARRMPWPIGEATAALVIMLPPDSEAFSSSMLEAVTPDAVLARPFTANAIKASLVMGFSQFRYERRLRSKAAKLEENLRAMRAIERAKSIVMSTRGVGSEEAYQYIRSQAMARRLSVSSFAEAIVSSFDLLGGLPQS